MVKISNEATSAIVKSYTKVASKESRYEATMNISREVAAKHKDTLRNLVDNHVDHSKKD